jgi:hypothetical protein
LSNVVKTPALNALAKQISVPDFQDWHDQSTVFDAMAYYGTRRVSVTVGTSAEYARRCATDEGDAGILPRL